MKVVNKPILILGYLNCDYLKEICSEFTALKKLYNKMNLIQLIAKPIRITENNESLLD